jgi:hypothetical protein
MKDDLAENDLAKDGLLRIDFRYSDLRCREFSGSSFGCRELSGSSSFVGRSLEIPRQAWGRIELAAKAAQSWAIESKQGARKRDAR